MPENDYELNKKIHKWEDDPSKEILLDLGEAYDYTIKYVKRCKKDKESNCWHQLDELHIYKGDELIASHHTHLDPYITIKDNIVCMTSDGECWVYDLKTNKENAISMPIVAFDHYIDFSEEQRQNIPNTFVVSGEGCYWACEAWPQGFEIYIDKDTLEEKRQDVWDEEDGYDAYIKELEEDDDNGEEN